MCNKNKVYIHTMYVKNILWKPFGETTIAPFTFITLKRNR